MASETLEAPPDFHDLLHAPNTAVLSTVLPDGSLQGSPVWYWFDRVLVHVSTLAGRQKYRNLRRDPRLALTVFDPAQPLRYIEIRGTAELHDDPDGEMRDRIAVNAGSRRHGIRPSGRQTGDRNDHSHPDPNVVERLGARPSPLQASAARSLLAKGSSPNAWMC